LLRIKAPRAIVSSLSAKQGSVKPMRAASKRKISALDLASPGGGTAGSFSIA
jgi:hypothetical protein